MKRQVKLKDNCVISCIVSNQFDESDLFGLANLNRAARLLGMHEFVIAGEESDEFGRSVDGDDKGGTLTWLNSIPGHGDCDPFLLPLDSQGQARLTNIILFPQVEKMRAKKQDSNYTP